MPLTPPPLDDILTDMTAEAWPADGLEHLGRCPVCSGASRAVLHENLQDRLFFCAPGTWVMWRCEDCRSAYLDPRPTPETIGLAYAAYYTHDATPPKALMERPKRWWGLTALRKRVCPAYRNMRYGYKLKPDLGWLNFLTLFLPRQIKLSFVESIRHLPVPGPDARLLDIGCGNGNFLRFAVDLGYAATGLEIDPAAVQTARAHGFDVVEGKLPDSGLESGRFDHVTLSHVVEHLHDPQAGLREIHRLLKSSGRVWLQFPNIDALGHEIYGPAWLGLDSPRHLVLPSLEGMKTMLASAGFVQIRRMKPADAVEGYFLHSDKIKSRMESPAAQAAPVAAAERRKTLKRERRHPERHEQLTLVAYKP